MIDVILAAGYATRMYPLTENWPKPLLEVNGRTILDSLLADVDAIPDVTRHIVVTNHRFAGVFNEWLEKCNYSKPIEIIDDGSTDNSSRVGAVRDLLLAIRRVDSPDEDYLVLAADNLLNFSLSGFADYFRTCSTSVIMYYEEPSLNALRRTGVVVLNPEGRVLEMEEKPMEPKSILAVPPFYIYSHRDIHLILDCIENGCGFDAPGNLARHICGRSVVHAWKMPGKRTDIGDLETYRRICGTE